MANRLIVLALLVVASNLAFGSKDHQESRRLMQEGEIMPLQQILDRISEERVGRVLEVELKQVTDQLIYEIELLGEEGVVWEYKVDAVTGDILKSELEK